MLYINITRPVIARPDWSTATHVLVEQEGEHAVVETTVDMLYGMEQESQPSATRQVQIRFTFIDGRIDYSDGFP